MLHEFKNLKKMNLLRGAIFCLVLLQFSLSFEQKPAYLKKELFKSQTWENLTNSRIVSGFPATPHDYPFMAALYVFVENIVYFCGGTLIHVKWVLSSSMCVIFATDIRVYLGSHNLTAEEPDQRAIYQASSYILHPDFNAFQLQNDIALVELSEEVQLNRYIQLIRLAFANETYTGTTGRVLGWGVTNTGAISDVLNYVNVEIISNDDCRENPDYEFFIIDQHICTDGANGVGHCNGDNGGPLIVNGIQIGIVSFTTEPCNLGYPSVYARTTYFNSWLNDTVGSLDWIDFERSGSIMFNHLSSLLIGTIFLSTFITT